MALKGRILKDTIKTSVASSSGGFDTNGVFHRKHNWTKDMLNDETIDAEPMDDEFDNYANGLSNCLTRDGRGKISKTFDFNNHEAMNLVENWTDDRGYAATVRQVVHDPTRIFEDVSTTGTQITLKPKYNVARLLPNDDYENGLYFIVCVRNMIERSSPKMVFEGNVPDTTEWTAVDANGVPLVGGVLQRGGVYMVCMRNKLFYFMNIIQQGTDYGEIERVQSDFMYCDRTGDGGITNITSDDIHVEITGEGVISDITSDFLYIYAGTPAGMQSITSPKGTLKINDSDPLRPTIDNAMRFTSPNGTILIDQEDPKDIRFESTYLLNITSPDETINIVRPDETSTELSLNHRIISDDGSIRCTKESPTLTSIVSATQYYSETNSITIRRNNTAYSFDDNVDYTSKDGSILISRNQSKPNEVDFKALGGFTAYTSNPTWWQELTEDCYYPVLKGTIAETRPALKGVFELNIQSHLILKDEAFNLYDSMKVLFSVGVKVGGVYDTDFSWQSFGLSGLAPMADHIPFEVAPALYFVNFKNDTTTWYVCARGKGDMAKQVTTWRSSYYMTSGDKDSIDNISKGYFNYGTGNFLLATTAANAIPLPCPKNPIT
jgi:hypothetical protein